MRSESCDGLRLAPHEASGGVWCLLPPVAPASCHAIPAVVESRRGEQGRQSDQAVLDASKSRSANESELKSSTPAKAVLVARVPLEAPSPVLRGWRGCSMGDVDFVTAGASQSLRNHRVLSVARVASCAPAGMLQDAIRPDGRLVSGPSQRPEQVSHPSSLRRPPGAAPSPVSKDESASPSTAPRDAGRQGGGAVGRRVADGRRFVDVKYPGIQRSTRVAGNRVGRSEIDSATANRPEAYLALEWAPACHLHGCL